MNACSVCKSTSRAKIERALSLGDSAAVVATRYGVGRSAIDNHRRKHMAPVAERPMLGESTPRSADASPLERARLNADEALAALQAAERQRLPAGDIAKLRNAVTAAEKLYGQRAAARVLTPAEIVKSAGFQALADEIAEVLRPFPEAARAVALALRAQR